MLSVKQAEEKMKKAIQHYEVELKNIRTGRANPAILDSVHVEVYGSRMRISDIASISVPEPMQLLVTPFDRTNSASIGKALESANLGFRIVTEGHCVRILVPPMDASVRTKMSKAVKELAEETKVSIRGARQDANKTIKADKELSEDDKKRQEKAVQDLTDKFCKSCDDLAAKKEKEIMTV